MQIYFKCSFKFGIGYQIGKYSTKTDILIPISEHDVAIHQNMSYTIAGTLQTQLGRSMLLAVDENGQLFMGVYGLIFGEYDKYVNAVFIGESSQETIQMFLYFCEDYCNANKQLLASISRDESLHNKAGFLVNSAQICFLLGKAKKIDSYANTYQSERGTFLIFATKETFSDYQISLSYLFKSPPILRIECIKDDAVQIEEKETIMKTFTSQQKKNSEKILLFVVAILIIIIAITISLSHRKGRVFESSMRPEITQIFLVDGEAECGKNLPDEPD